jgi:hypothetical protein
MNRDIRQASPSNGVHLSDYERYEALHAMAVSEVKTRQIDTVFPDPAELEASTTFLEQKFDCLPRVDAEAHFPDPWSPYLDQAPR